jgi:blocked early in transport 1
LRWEMLGKKGANRVFRGQYSDAVLNELESQNDGQVEGIMGKVRQLKDVCFFLCSVGELC